MFLGAMALALLLKTCAGVALTQDLELGPVLAQVLHETALRRNWAGPLGLLVLLLHTPSALRERTSFTKL